VILLYLESFGNPRRFGDIARRVGATKPIVAVKAGRSRAGARAACSHTGALASSDVVVDALFRDAGVIRTETLEELFDVATLVAHQPIPAGRRIAILTNAGGPGILAADACEALGLTLPTPGTATLEALRSFLPAAASVANPVDMLATAPAEHYRRALALLLADAGVDAVLTIFIPPLVTDSAEVARAIADTARGAAKPVLATFFGAAGVPDILAPVPCYVFPEAAVRALAHAVRYGEWRRRPLGKVEALAPGCLAAARAVVATALARGGGWLTPQECTAVLAASGIASAATLPVASADDAVAAAEAIGYPVVVKGWSPTLVHKTEAHAVFTDVADAHAVRHAWQDLASRPDVTQVLVQQSVDGVEMMAGATLDPLFGHAVMCGSGGTHVELLRDTTCRLAPVTDLVAGEMLESIRGSALLRGFRGAPVADEAAYRHVILRLSALLDACPAIVDVDFNPVIVTARDARVVDARIRVASS
jgi:acyl-CoA synthetase (NDP forming)